MKKLQCLMIVGLILGMGAAGAWADVNEEMTFTNFTNEDIQVELSVLDHSGWTTYSLTVFELHTSIANFWVDSIFSTFSVCAYGVFTDDFYGCIEGDLSLGPHYAYFDNSGIPYLSGPPDVVGADLFLFDNPNTAADVLVVEGDAHGHHGGGCFIGSL